jgi:hypothetical protein
MKTLIGFLAGMLLAASVGLTVQVKGNSVIVGVSGDMPTMRYNGHNGPALAPIELKAGEVPPAPWMRQDRAQQAAKAYPGPKAGPIKPIATRTEVKEPTLDTLELLGNNVIRD